MTDTPEPLTLQQVVERLAAGLGALPLEVQVKTVLAFALEAVKALAAAEAERDRLRAERPLAERHEADIREALKREAAAWENQRAQVARVRELERELAVAIGKGRALYDELRAERDRLRAELDACREAKP